MAKTKMPVKSKTKKEKKQDPKLLVESLVKELFRLLGSTAGVSVAEDKENEAFLVNIDAGEETGLLIGRRGETLFAIQHVLSTMVKHQTGEWSRIIVNVGDWREKQQAYLENLARQTAERVKETGQPQTLYNLTPPQRRVIHITLSGLQGITTESAGEGTDRCLIVKKTGSVE